MKRKFFILFVTVFFLFLGGESLAANPPAKICAQLVDENNPQYLMRMVLVVKSAGSIKMHNGSVTYYSVNGFMFSQPGADKWNYPLVGEGQMKQSDNRFYLSLTGSTVFSGTFFSANMAGIWVLDEKIGVIGATISGTKGNTTADTFVTFMMTEVSCNAMEIPEIPIQ